MTFLELFKIKKEGVNHLIFLEDFYNYLRKTDNKLRKFNLKRTLQKYQAGVVQVDGNDAIPVFSVLKYCFLHEDDSESCNTLTKEVERELLHQCHTERIPSSLDLYKLIAKARIHDNSPLFDSLEVDEDEIETLLKEHKPLFTSKEWTKICWFEHHFARSSAYSLQLTSENLLSLKYSNFQSLLCFQDVCKQWHNVSKQQIKEKLGRYQSSETENQVTINVGRRHLPSVIDDELITLFETYHPDLYQNVTCFDVTNSTESYSIQVVVSYTSTNKQNHDLDNDLCSRAFYHIKRKHEIFIDKIYFCDAFALQQFTSDDETVSRFHLRDAVETKQLNCFLNVWSAETLPDISECVFGDNEDCVSCFSGVLKKPLTANAFNLLKEWYLETPVETQILLERFINENTIRRHKNQEQYYKEKLGKIYSVYDVLLHFYNKKFIGIFQQRCANELLVEYKSISTVFGLTSGTGITPSLKTAENQLKKHSSQDLCYYNTFLKDHELKYDTVLGEWKTLASLRQCHVILMLDNLVRLRYVSDPSPGENRSNQICTLPITLQGLPNDHKITEFWHLPECDGSFNCVCKQQEQLKKRDIDRVLLRPQESEQEAYEKFNKLMTFGYSGLWKRLPDEILSYLDESSDGNKESDCVNIADSSNTHSITDLQAGCSAEDQETRTEDDVDLEDILQLLTSEESNTKDSNEDYNGSYSSDEDIQNISGLETSFCHLSILENEPEPESFRDIQKLLQTFGFTKYKVPPLLCRHPPPATGRDDDITKIKEILSDVLMKMGYESDKAKTANRILCGPDNKIGKCVFRLMETNKRFRVFLPEFPLLHLRKSKITILFSAYKDAGIVQILKFMREEDQEDWAKLVSIQHIDMATKYVRRIALALHLAFVIVFAQSLESGDLELFMNEMESTERSALSDTWFEKFETFLEIGSEKNATFALHVDMMRHCDHVVAIALAERLGGPIGYKLLLAAVKGSLIFSFVNNASSYAPYCVQLLYEHYSAGFFHKNLKECLFSTPFKCSLRNFACDTKREMDHLDVLKGFRSGSNISSVTCRMSLIDSLNETRRAKDSPEDIIDDDQLGWELKSVDESHIFPATALILKRNGLSLEESDVPMNVYTKTPIVLPAAIIDACSESAGKFLLLRYLVKEKLFNLSENDRPLADDVQGPKELVARAKRSTGVTIKRTLKSKVQTVKTERQTVEEKRQKQVDKETKLIDCFSSANNSCQTLLKADSSKPKVIKSLGMQRALKNLLSSCLTTVSSDHPFEYFINTNATAVPQSITQSMKICTVEFAGVKFKLGCVKSGKEYLQVVETMLRRYMKHAENVSKLVICEEKYSFTPDDFKASTREQRKTSSKGRDVDHLKTVKSYLNEETFNKDIITKTDAGKQAISTYLAENVSSLTFDGDIEVVVDSELLKKKVCSSGKNGCPERCKCNKYCTPVLYTYSNQNDKANKTIKQLQNIKQCKGEAEMAVVDWLIHYQNELKDGDTAVCVVTSGDIDAVCIHLFALCRYWHRNENGKFKNHMYVILQKPQGKIDIYNMTALLEVFEEVFKDRMFGCKIAVALCIGGNDFIPKSYQISHDTILKLFTDSVYFRQCLVSPFSDHVQLNFECFLEFYKSLFCPKRLLKEKLSYEKVRAVTIGKSRDESKGSCKTNDPRKWLPPRSATERLCSLIQLQIDYLGTAGTHDTPLPDFLGSNCLRKNSSGEIEYDFGPESHFESLNELPDVHVVSNQKRRLDNTPQSGARRKRPLTSTPKRA